MEHESERAGGRVCKTLWDSGDDENDDGHGCEKMGSLSLPGDSVSGCKLGGCGGSTSRETWRGVTQSPRTTWRE